jgi:plastocyanin
MKLRSSVSAGLVLGAAVLWSSAPATGTTGCTVVLEDVAFKPARLRIARGSRVTFQWRDFATPHTVTSRGRPRFRGTGERTRGKHVVRFTRSGTYRYVCTVHPGMAGRIVVR